MYSFRNDYSEGAHPAVLKALLATNLEGNIGYGGDAYCARAAELIRSLCKAPEADVQFLIGGTQTNFVAIAAFLRPWEGVICAETGHVNGHEAGAVEATGHKLFQVPVAADGKLSPAHLAPIVEAGENPHTVLPRLVYISDATECGAIYTKAELISLSAYCKANDLYLFLDGARLGVALAAEGNDLTLPDLAELTDAFYIGGTKNGALMGEALVICNPALQPDFFRFKKQQGGVLAKGWLLGVQFEALLQDGLRALGLRLMPPSPTNQVFVLVPDGLLPKLDQLCAYEIWTRRDDGHAVIRLVTSFATRQETVDGFLQDLEAVLLQQSSSL
ncbi:MAG: beta-eliminating lyase-related protein [Pseudoflavonifractor sp.]